MFAAYRIIRNRVSSLIHSIDDRLRHLDCSDAVVTIKVARHDLALTNDRLESVLDAVCAFEHIEVSKHHRAGEQQRCGVRDILASDVRRRSVYRLEDRDILADVCARCQTESADKTTGKIRQDITEKV